MKRKRRIRKSVVVIFIFICILIISLGIYFIMNNNKGNANEVNNGKVLQTLNEKVEENTTDDNEKNNEEITKEEIKQEETKKEEIKKDNVDNSFTTSKGFKGYIKNGLTYIDGILIVNKSYSLPSTYAPGMNQNVVNAANKMFAAALVDNLSIKLQSGFRSYDTQKSIYNRYVSQRGKDAADTFSARPGYSEHQSGLAFDVCESSGKYSDACINSNFDSTVEAAWLSKNAYKYGFILRYPKGKTNETGYKHESWHFRYVGEELASKLYNNGDWITLEDYFGIDSQYKN